MIVLIAINIYLMICCINGLADPLAERVIRLIQLLRRTIHRIMLDSNRHGLIRRVGKGDHVLIRIAGERQRLDRRLDGVIHNAIAIHDRRGGDLGHGHDGAADFRFLRGLQFLRHVALEHVTDGILRRRATRIIEGNDVFILAYGKFDGLGRRIDAVAGNGKRVNRDLQILREAGAGDRLGGRKFLIRARFHIPNRIGKRVHFPMSVNGRIVGDRLVLIELYVAGFRRIPAGEGVTITGRGRKFSNFRAPLHCNSIAFAFAKRTVHQFQSDSALRHRPICIQRQTCRHLIIAAVKRRVIRIGIPARKICTIHRLGNLSSIKNRFKVRVILDLLRRNQHTVLVVQIQLIFFRSIVEMNLLTIGCTCSKGAAFIVPFIITDNLVKIGSIKKIVKLDIHRLVKAIGDAIPRFRFYSISCLIRIVIFEPVMQSLRFLRRKSKRIYRPVSGRHRIDSYKFIIIVGSEVPCTGFSINCNRIKFFLPKLRDVRTILCSQLSAAIIAAYYPAISAIVLAIPSNSIPIASILRIHNRRPIRFHHGAICACEGEVRRVKRAGRTARRNSRSNLSSSNRACQIRIIIVICIFNLVNDRIINVLRFPLRIHRHVVIQPHARISRVRALRIGIPARKLIALTGRSRCLNRRRSIARRTMRVLRQTTIQAPIVIVLPPTSHVATALLATILRSSGISIMRMLRHSARQYRFPIRARPHIHRCSPRRRLRLDIRAAHAVVGQGHGRAVIIYVYYVSALIILEH